MNVRKFKEIIREQNYNEENFRIFRAWENNCYDNYQKNMRIAYYNAKEMYVKEEDFLASDENSVMEYQWKYIGYDSMVELHNRMGWQIDEKISKRRMSHDNVADCVFFYVDFDDIYEKIEGLEDNIEFTYAILMLIENAIDSNRKIYAEYVCKVYEGIRECGLEDCLKLIDDSKTKKVFIAMSFAENMKEVRKNIERAVKDSGYVPMLIDVKEHNNQIVPEIYKEIEESSFIVADLTGQRGGVYYEAGYAMAKEKPLILSCKKDKKEKPHFDVAQINTIFWQDEEDLYNRLVNRIKATVGENR